MNQYRTQWHSWRNRTGTRSERYVPDPKDVDDERKFEILIGTEDKQQRFTRLLEILDMVRAELYESELNAGNLD